MSKETVRILFVGNSPDDVEQATVLLRNSNYVLKTDRVEDLSKLEQSLTRQPWDAILCEPIAGKLDAHQALALVRKYKPNVPFLVVVRKISDGELNKIMAIGANDVITKDQWCRLLPALRRELAVARERRRLAEIEKSLEDLESRYRVIAEGAQEAVGYCHEGMHVDANPAYLRLFGYEEVEDLKGVPILNLANKRDQARMKTCLRKASQENEPQEFNVVSTDGREFTVEMLFTPITISGEQCVQVAVSDISKRKALEDKLVHMQQRDCLTGLYNRSYFMKELDRAIDSARTGKEHHTLICIQINNLKQINNILGHAECDKMLLMVARIMRETTDEKHYLGRIRNSEFAVLLPACQPKLGEAVKRELEKKLRSLPVEKKVDPANTVFNVQLVVIDQKKNDRRSILDAGFAPQPSATAAKEAQQYSDSERSKGNIAKDQRPASAESVLEISQPVRLSAETDSTAEPTAEVANKTKNAAKEVSTPPGPQPDERSPASPTASVSAFDESNLQLLFQPIINLVGEPAELFEIQPHIVNKSGEYIPLAEYINIGDNSGIAIKIDRLIIQKTIDLIHSESRQHHDTRFFIGISGSTLTDEILPTVIAQHLKTFGLSANRLYFQFDAADVIKHFESARQFINKLKEIGSGIVIDNFDNARLTADKLTTVGMDFLRIDSSLATAGEDKDDTPLRHAIAGAGELKTPIIVYNVEDANLFSSLYSLKADYVQGDYLYPASLELDVDFSEEQTLDSQEIKAPNWTASA